MKTLKLYPVFILCSLLLSCTREPISVASTPLYETVPNIANCTTGSLSEVEKQRVLTYINSMRATHNLPLVNYDSKKDRLAQEAALIGAANASISENIVETDYCYSINAASECRNGNRSLWGSASSKWPLSEIHVDDWLTELNSNNINNRRRLLDPFLKSVTFGRIIGVPKKGEFKYVSSATLLMSYGNANFSEHNILYIAYPEGNYSAKLFDPNSFLSFSVLHDTITKSNNGASLIDFSETKVEVSAGSQTLNIVENSLTYDYNNIGLPNNLQWKVQGLAKNTSYTVKISGVKVAGDTTDYRYTFSFK